MTALRRLGLVVALAAPLGVKGAQQQPAAARTVTVQLLAVNDFHGNLEPPSGDDGRVNGTEAGGAEYLAAHLARDIADHPNSIVVSAGDVIGASPLVSSLFHDEPTIEAMNAMHLAVSSVGNHEFDHGIAELLRMKRGGCHPIDGCEDGDGFDGAAFQYLSANVVRRATGTTLFPATAVRTVGGVKIGFIGETLRGTPQIVAAPATRGLRFLDEASTANAYAARLERQGVHAIVLLIHQGGEQKPVGAPHDPNGCSNFDGGIEPILAKLTPDIRVVVSGHTHRFYNCRIDDRVVTSAGAYGRMLTRIDLEIDPRTDRIQRASAVNEIVTRDVAPDPAIAHLVAKYEPLAERTGGTVVGSVTAEIRKLANAAGESALGDVIADADLAATAAAPRGPAAVAFMNSGGIRADIAPERAATPGQPRAVTYANLFSVQPFGNVLMVFTMTGDSIKRLLEQQFDNPRPGARAMLQVSNGFSYRYRVDAPAGQHVDADSITIGGRVVRPTDRIRVVAPDFIVTGGNGYPALGESTERAALVSDIDALVAYFRAHSPVAPGPQNRIVRVD